MRFLALILCSLLGFAAAHMLHLGDIHHAGLYSLCITALLAVGLYASTYGISLAEARTHSRLILSAVTVGVLAKAAIIGLSLWAIFGDPFFVVLGVVVAQIDPLSVASLMHGERLSKKAKTIIACWASFDDPVTVILAFYVPVVVMHANGSHLAGATAHSWESGLLGLAKDLAANALLAGVIFAIWRFLRARQMSGQPRFGRAGEYVLLMVALLFAIAKSLMLGVAVAGLFLRPKRVGALLDGAIAWIFRIAMVLMGVLLVHGVAIWKGIALGVAAYGSQIIVGWILTRHLSLRDRLHIAFAQQNGITAIILALLFEPIHPGTVAIVAPAVVAVSGLHTLANAGVDRFLRSGLSLVESHK